MTKLGFPAFVALCVALQSAPAAAQSERAGETVRVQPDVYQRQALLPSTLGVGDDVYRNAKVMTERYGSTEIRFEDDTLLTIGPSSEVVIDDYVYSPSSGAGEMSVRMGKGVLRLISGRVPAEGVRLRTPVATIGIRGTSFWIDSTDIVEVDIWVEEGTVLATPDQGDQTFELVAPVFATCSIFRCTERDGPAVPGAFPSAPTSPFSVDTVEDGRDDPGGTDSESSEGENSGF
ncbi:MAG: FecR domain-containing protein [Pseudomonadota bacterium]